MTLLAANAIALVNQPSVPRFSSAGATARGFGGFWSWRIKLVEEDVVFQVDVVD
jgi:hypothetical protein